MAEVKKVKVAIIGAGTAGLSARREVAKQTHDYVVIEGGALGTTCARVGCMPSKVLIQAANDFDRRCVFASEGIYGAEKLHIDPSKVMEFVRKLRDRFVKGVLNDIKSWQDKIIREYVSFVDANTLKTESGKLTKADKIIIATGSKPLIPKSWQAYQDYLIDTNSFFELTEMPEKMVVVGLGVIGIELGQALAKLGLDVTLVGLGKSIGGLSDPILQDYVADKFTKQLNISYEGADVVGMKDGRLQVKIGDKVHLFDKALLAMGRAPNLNGLGLG
ncbi:FAD-dependent oxidoreductase [Facilibium subflavum]|uniref:FAD-dependent oxidoreductase n=1 Tax=Facilibium subflavum TaxID=2219058 RepID=UPI000E65DD71|nr:FAD-dependent oxidoreductase [Facilibium subflavum]